MKTIFVEDILKNKLKNVKLFCWIKNARSHGGIIFLDLIDSTGEIQAVIPKKVFGKKQTERLKPETAVLVEGDYQLTMIDKKENDEILVSKISILAESKKDYTPKLRGDFDIFSSKYADLTLKNRDLYLRNPKISASLKFKSKYVFELHKYFQDNGYTLFEAPVLTERLLYEDSTAFSFKFLNRDVWLSQCCTFQLEPSIISLEKVYNITPSFRAEHSRSDRHLNEYTHLKVELAWVELEDLIHISEDLLYNIAKKMNRIGKKELSILNHKIKLEDLKPPYKRITYDECVKLLQKNGINFEWGKSIGNKDLSFLTKYFGEKPLWIQYIPRSAEGFPFKIYEKDRRLTVVSDLIAPYGFGEIMGTAEKICDKKELIERMEEKGKTTPDQMKRYKSYVELRDAGLPFHGGIGMGVDRVARFLMGLPHVKDVLPYPRLFGRKWNP